jgi:hypothetical protein
MVVGTSRHTFCWVMKGSVLLLLVFVLGHPLCSEASVTDYFGLPAECHRPTKKFDPQACWLHQLKLIIPDQ